MPVVLGHITISLEATADGDLLVHTELEGGLNYITAIGMLEMAKDDIPELIEGSDD